MNYDSNSNGSMTGNLQLAAEAVARPLIPKQSLGVTLPRLLPSKKAASENKFDGQVTNKVLASLPGEDLIRLLPHFEPVKLSSMEEVYRYGEGVHFAYFPETVVISLLHIMTDGSVTEAAMVGREGLLGLSALFSSPQPEYMSQVLVGGTGLKIKMDTLRQEFERGGALQRLLLQYTNARLAQISQRAVCNGRHTVEERFCTWLLMVHDRHRSDSLPMTHEQISRHLGSRRAGITGIATALRERNIIDYSRGVIRIVDRPALQLAACECYKALSQVFQTTQ